MQHFITGRESPTTSTVEEEKEAFISLPMGRRAGKNLLKDYLKAQLEELDWRFTIKTLRSLWR